MDMLLQQLLQDYSAIDSKTRQLNTSLQQLVSDQNQQLGGIHVALQNLSNQTQQLYQHLEGIQTVLNNETTQLNTLHAETRQIVDGLVTPGQYPSFPAPSCAALPPSSPTGFYWVSSSSGLVLRVYCDMTRSCGGVTGGWTHDKQHSPVSQWSQAAHRW